MSKVKAARRLAAAAAFGGGGLTALGALGAGMIRLQAQAARRAIGAPHGFQAPKADGFYGHGSGRPMVFGMLGDSTSVGLGADHPHETPGAIMAAALAEASRRPVKLATVGQVGAESSALRGQVHALLSANPHPSLCVIMVGGNDVTHRVKLEHAVRSLQEAVIALRAAGSQVVVATCPDLGTIRPVPQPLRSIAKHMSRRLAAAQTIAVIEAGGRTVSLADLMAPQFWHAPDIMFSADRFHPSAEGYRRCALAIVPSVLAACGLTTSGESLDSEAHSATFDITPAAIAAVAAAADGGTEVSLATRVGSLRGKAGRWVQLKHWREAPMPDPDDLTAHPAPQPSANPDVSAPRPEPMNPRPAI